MSDSALLRERLPAFPDVPDAQRGRGDVYVRYEDVTQDGRLAARAASHAIGAAVWRDVLERHPLTPVLDRARASCRSSRAWWWSWAVARLRSARR
jgi:hypothetical protein